MLRIAFQTFGCKLNFAETSAIARKLSEGEFCVVDFSDEADVYVIHSCMVTAQAEKKTLQAVRQAHRRSVRARIAVAGCMAELQEERLRKEPGVSLVLGNSDKFRLEEFLLDSGSRITRLTEAGFEASWSVSERTRSFLKIQDGCDYFCAYCTIPLARGRSRSGTVAEILKAAEEITARGVKEIVLTGVNIGDFGRQNGETLYQLLLELHQTEGLERLRISSIEPDLLEERIVSLSAEYGRLLPHFHIPLQAGSNEVLRLMKRRYTTALFSEKVSMIRALLPRACIATDLICGFPGESDSLFGESLEYINLIDISYLHVFSYSVRKGTHATQLPYPVSPLKIRERSLAFHHLSDRKKQAFYNSNTGRQARVFFESRNRQGYLYGFTENYIKVRHPWSAELVNSIQTVTLLTSASADYLNCVISKS